MKKALVLGGTKFFGTFLINHLLNNGFEVTVATRGLTEDAFGDSVRRIVIDRDDIEQYIEKFQGCHWDVIYDQICYSSKNALQAINVFRNKTKKYIMTSSLSVYQTEKGEPFVEADFEPNTKDIIVGTREAFSYDEGKQQAEAVFFQQAPFPVIAVRFPIVLGEKDYTDRLAFYIKKIKNNEGVLFTNPEAEMCFISEQEAGSFLSWLATSEVNGPINACSNGTISMRRLMELIADVTGQKVIYSKDIRENSPYNIPETWVMSNGKAADAGYPFTNLEDWLPGLIRVLDRKVNG